MSICNNGKYECKNWSIWWGVLNMRKSNIFIITSLVMTCVIVGAGATNVFASAISKERNEINLVDEPCILCKAKNANEEKGPGCESCNEAVAFAVDYMKDYVKENIKNTYFLWSVDASIVICEGLIIGFRESCINNTILQFYQIRFLAEVFAFRQMKKCYEALGPVRTGLDAFDFKG